MAEKGVIEELEEENKRLKERLDKIHRIVVDRLKMLDLLAGYQELEEIRSLSW